MGIEEIPAILASIFAAAMITLVALTVVDHMPCIADPNICAQSKNNSIFVIATADAMGGIGTFAAIKRLFN